MPSARPPGSNPPPIPLLRAVAALDGYKAEGDLKIGVDIVRRALEEPLRQIAINAGQNAPVVAARVREGKADFGLTLSGEVASVPGAVIAGPLPAPFGQDTVYCAAVWSGSAVKDVAADFIAALTKPDTKAAWKKAGFETP